MDQDRTAEILLELAKVRKLLEVLLGCLASFLARLPGIIHVGVDDVRAEAAALATILVERGLITSAELKIVEDRTWTAIQVERAASPDAGAVEKDVQELVKTLKRIAAG